jgi:two-component system, chemotaxis family, chemotaxis protein CheY
MAFNVLIVDDSATMRALIRKVLGIAGFQVGQYFEGANGLEALEILKREWVDVILTDVHMPEMDGLTLVGKIRQDEIWQNIPVVFITTEGRPELVEQFSALGVEGYIKKPFRPEEIKNLLAGIMGEADGTAVGDSEECDF